MHFRVYFTLDQSLTCSALLLCHILWWYRSDSPMQYTANLYSKNFRSGTQPYSQLYLYLYTFFFPGEIVQKNHGVCRLWHLCGSWLYVVTYFHTPTCTCTLCGLAWYWLPALALLVNALANQMSANMNTRRRLVHEPSASCSPPMTVTTCLMEDEAHRTKLL